MKEIKGIKKAEFIQMAIKCTGIAFASMINDKHRGPKWKWTAKNLAEFSFTLGALPYFYSNEYGEQTTAIEYNQTFYVIKDAWLLISFEYATELLKCSGVKDDLSHV